jgi:hypothetical protein
MGVSEQARQLLDESLDRRIGGAFVPYLFLASYARRF